MSIKKLLAVTMALPLLAATFVTGSVITPVNAAPEVSNEQAENTKHRLIIGNLFNKHSEFYDGEGYAWDVHAACSSNVGVCTDSELTLTVDDSMEIKDVQIDENFADYTINGQEVNVTFKNENGEAGIDDGVTIAVGLYTQVREGFAVKDYPDGLIISGVLSGSNAKDSESTGKIANYKSTTHSKTTYDFEEAEPTTSKSDTYESQEFLGNFYEVTKTYDYSYGENQALIHAFLTPQDGVSLYEVGGALYNDAPFWVPDVDLEGTYRFYSSLDANPDNLLEVAEYTAPDFNNIPVPKGAQSYTFETYRPKHDFSLKITLVDGITSSEKLTEENYAETGSLFKVYDKNGGMKVESRTYKALPEVADYVASPEAISAIEKTVDISSTIDVFSETSKKTIKPNDVFTHKVSATNESDTATDMTFTFRSKLNDVSKFTIDNDSMKSTVGGKEVKLGNIIEHEDTYIGNRSIVVPNVQPHEEVVLEYDIHYTGSLHRAVEFTTRVSTDHDFPLTGVNYMSIYAAINPVVKNTFEVREIAEEGNPLSGVRNIETGKLSPATEGEFYRYPNVVRTLPNGLSEWRMSIESLSTENVSDQTGIYIFDDFVKGGLSVGGDVESAWMPQLAGPVSINGDKPHESMVLYITDLGRDIFDFESEIVEGGTQQGTSVVFTLMADPNLVYALEEQVTDWSAVKGFIFVNKPEQSVEKGDKLSISFPMRNPDTISPEMTKESPSWGTSISDGMPNNTDGFGHGVQPRKAGIVIADDRVVEMKLFTIENIVKSVDSNIANRMMKISYSYTTPFGELIEETVNLRHGERYSGSAPMGTRISVQMEASDAEGFKWENDVSASEFEITENEEENEVIVTNTYLKYVDLNTEPTLSESTCDVKQTVILPETEGVEYTVTENEETNTAEVTAVALEGYVIPDDATATWTLQYEEVEKCVIYVTTIAPTLTWDEKTPIVTIPDVEGVIYISERVDNTITVTATPEEGYLFTEDSATTWEFDVTPEVESIPATPLEPGKPAEPEDKTPLTPLVPAKPSEPKEETPMVPLVPAKPIDPENIVHDDDLKDDKDDTDKNNDNNDLTKEKDSKDKQKEKIAQTGINLDITTLGITLLSLLAGTALVVKYRKTTQNN